MFDDFVEHAALPPGAVASGAQAYTSQLQYEGFEPSPYETEDNQAQLELMAMEGNDNTQVGSVFGLGRVQYTLPASLVHVVASSETLVMGLYTNTIIWIELGRSEQTIKIPRKPTEFTMYKLFLDPSGRHLVATSTQGENWYLYRGWQKPRQLKSFKMVIESVAWNKLALLGGAQSSTSSREMLIGARNGTIYEAVLNAEEDFFRSQDRYLQAVYSLPERHPITGLKFDFFPTNNPTKALIIATTPSRIYQFTGIPERKSGDDGKLFTTLFAGYRDNVTPTISEVPGTQTHSELHFYTSNGDQATSLPTSLAWLTGLGIYHGALNFESSSDNLIDGAQLLPYSYFFASSPPLAGSDIPIAIALTEFHFIVLYRDRVAAVSALDEKLAYEEAIPLESGEVVLGLTSDPVRQGYWVYTDQSIFEIVATNESRDVWKSYLEKKKFDSALQYAKTAFQRDTVLCAQARAQFDEGMYFPAAQAFSQCSVPFEEVSLKFLDAGQRDALRSYLVSRLERTRRTDLTQRMMLATWLVEFYLSKCNELDDLVASESVSHDVENLLAERTILEDDLKHFFETYKANLDSTTVYELIQGHGRIDMYLHYATVVGDLDRVIEHWISEEDWKKAIDVISRQNDLELYYRFASVLMRNSPQDTVEAWRRQSNLDPLRLIPALLQHQSNIRDALAPNYSLRYLHHVVFDRGSTASTIHNLILTFHIQNGAAGEGGLLRFLNDAPTDPSTGRPFYDLDYALRLCKGAGRTQACVHIYAKMGMWEESVDLALEKGDLELAKVNADMPHANEDKELRRKLWLKIAKYVVQDKQDIKAAMRFLESTDLLQVEDILPFFPDFVVIDDFKDEICNALESYAAHIDSLRREMDDATRNAEAIKKDVVSLQNRFVTLDATERCAECKHPLLTRPFYVFPCQHSFHADCLVGMVKEYLPTHALRRILALQSEIGAISDAFRTPVDRNTIAPPVPAIGARQPPVSQRTLLSSTFTAPLQMGRGLLTAGDRLRDLIIPDALATIVTNPLVGITGQVSRRPGERDEKAKVKGEKARKELEDILAAACPLCESVVVGLDKPFVKKDESDTSWDL